MSVYLTPFAVHVLNFISLNAFKNIINVFYSLMHMKDEKYTEVGCKILKKNDHLGDLFEDNIKIDFRIYRVSTWVAFNWFKTRLNGWIL
jgi:hypothetical protein